jgi:hypothetical protein
MVSHEDAAMITKFAEAVKAGNLFETFVPLSTTEWEYGVAIDEWGTKWDITAGDLSISEDGKEVSGWFETPWGPGIRAYEKMSELGFDMEVIFHEPGMCFAGKFTSPDEDYYVEYNFENDNWREEIEDTDVLEMLEYEYENWLSWNEENKEEDGSE